MQFFHRVHDTQLSTGWFHWITKASCAVFNTTLTRSVGKLVVNKESRLFSETFAKRNRRTRWMTFRSHEPARSFLPHLQLVPLFALSSMTRVE